MAERVDTHLPFFIDM